MLLRYRIKAANRRLVPFVSYTCRDRLLIGFLGAQLQTCSQQQPLARFRGTEAIRGLRTASAGVNASRPRSTADPFVHPPHPRHPPVFMGVDVKRLRQRRGAIHPQGDLVGLCIHTGRVCLNGTSFSMGHMKHVTQTHQHPTRTPLLCHHPSFVVTSNARETGTKTQTNMFTELSREGRTLWPCCFFPQMQMQMFIRVPVFRNAAVHNCICVSLKYDPGM